MELDALNDVNEDDNLTRVTSQLSIVRNPDYPKDKTLIDLFEEQVEKNPDNLVYMVSYVDYPKYSIHSDSTELVEDFFKTTVETAVESVKGELSYSSDITMNEYPGRLWRVDYNDGKALIKTKYLT